MNYRPYVLLSSAIALAACATSPQPASTPPADDAAVEGASPAEPSSETDTGATGDERDLVARGKDLYAEKCADCHGDAGQGGDQAPPVVGAEALPLEPRQGQNRNVQFRTALDVLDWVKTNMPPKEGLSEDEALAIIAFDLTANGIQLPAEGFTRETAAQIVLHPQN